MIGDAVLARFDGKSGEERALAAARGILKAAADAALPRTLGIGIHAGEVISGAIGPSDRRDFTVICDTVNIAARMFSGAGEREIVADAQFADDAFGPVEEMRVKGRNQVLHIRRQTIA